MNMHRVHMSKRFLHRVHIRAFSPVMTWKDFVSRWRPVVLTRLGIPARTVYAWRDGSKEPPEGWQRDAAEFWIEAKAGEPEKKPKAPKK